jgi:glycosyltransferase involved in cell wall biosynthesis
MGKIVKDQPRIFYRCPDPQKPSGGVRVIYDHVDILNRNGFEAYVLHKNKGFRCNWFDNDTRIENARNVRFSERDFLVLPEIYATHYIDEKRFSGSYRLFRSVFDSACKVIIFNQNAYLTFDGHPLGFQDMKTIYKDKKVIGAMVVSVDNQEYINLAFPHLNPVIIPNAINAELFSFKKDKEKQICFMPRKNFRDAVQVLNILKHMDALKGFKIVEIDNVNEKEVARIFKQSMLFLSFGYPEGFSLPPAEAMACGCVVVGYHGMGGREYFNRNFCYPVETGNIISFVREVEAVINDYMNNPERMIERAKTASKLILESYNRQRQSVELISFWNSFINKQQ